MEVTIDEIKQITKQCFNKDFNDHQIGMFYKVANEAVKLVADNGGFNTSEPEVKEVIKEVIKEIPADSGVKETDWSKTINVFKENKDKVAKIQTNSELLVGLFDSEEKSETAQVKVFGSTEPKEVNISEISTIKFLD